MPNSIDAFIARWEISEGAARANYAMFLSELCDTIGVTRPDPASGGLGDYRFERSVVRNEHDGSTSKRRIDLYKRDCFIVEAKQASAVPRQPSLFDRAAQSEADRRAVVRRSPGWTNHMLGGKGQVLDDARHCCGLRRLVAVLENAINSAQQGAARCAFHPPRLCRTDGAGSGEGAVARGMERREGRRQHERRCRGSGVSRSNAARVSSSAVHAAGA